MDYLVPKKEATDGMDLCPLTEDAFDEDVPEDPASHEDPVSRQVDAFR